MSRHVDISAAFSFHAGGPETTARHLELRSVLRQAAHELESLTPECPEQTTALNKLREAMMWGNQAIAMHSPAG